MPVRNPLYVPGPNDPVDRKGRILLQTRPSTPNRKMNPREWALLKLWIEQNPDKKFSRGDLHPNGSGKVFWGYNRSCVDGESWMSAEQLERHRARMRATKSTRYKNIITRKPVKRVSLLTTVLHELTELSKLKFYIALENADDPARFLRETAASLLATRAALSAELKLRGSAKAYLRSPSRYEVDPKEEEDYSAQEQPQPQPQPQNPHIPAYFRNQNVFTSD